MKLQLNIIMSTSFAIVTVIKPIFAPPNLYNIYRYQLLSFSAYKYSPIMAVMKSKFVFELA